jgi:hypothetical protein
VEFYNPKEYNSSNTRNSINIEIVVVTYQNWEPRTHYHTNHRSVTNDLETIVQPLADNSAAPEQIDDANNNNGPTRNDDQRLADNPATTDQIDGANNNSGSTKNDDQSLADYSTTNDQIDNDNNNSSTIPDDAEQNNPSKLIPSEIESILSNPRKNQNLESMAAWLNYYTIADDRSMGTLQGSIIFRRIY